MLARPGCLAVTWLRCLADGIRRHGLVTRRVGMLPLVAVLAALPQAGWSEESGTPPQPAPAVEEKPAAPEVAPDFKLPGLVVNRKERWLDVDATICLAQGSLELIACTKDSKEHESIIAVEALPMHMHAALLLLGAKPGNPAMRRLIDEESGRWVDIPPRGGPVEVFLVFKDQEGKTVERPISDFIVRSDYDPDTPTGPDGDADDEADDGRFPTHTFLFAGSLLYGPDGAPRSYLCDESGNVISLVTFGDELLCLPETHSADNSALMWSIDSKHLPPLGTKVILRLKPRFTAAEEGARQTPAAPPAPPTPSPDQVPPTAPASGETPSRPAP